MQRTMRLGAIAIVALPWIVGAGAAVAQSSHSSDQERYPAQIVVGAANVGSRFTTLAQIGRSKSPAGVSRVPLGLALSDCMINPELVQFEIASSPGVIDPAADLPVTTFNEGQFECVARTARFAGLAYQAMANDRAVSSDINALGTASSLGVAVLGAGHAAADTLRFWQGLGAIFLIRDELTATKPRSRLYSIGAQALRAQVLRAAALQAATQALSATVAGGDDELSLSSRIADACELDSLRVLPKAYKADADFVLNISKAISTLDSRCSDLTNAETKLHRAQKVWSSSERGVIQNLATDIADFDATIARLDRGLRARPSETLSVVLRAPLNLASNLVGGSGPADYSGRNLSLVAAPYDFELRSLPSPGYVQGLEVPSLISPGSGVPANLQKLGGSGQKQDARSLFTDLQTRTHDINKLIDQVNDAIIDVQILNAVNRTSTMRVNFGADARPLTMVAPGP
ncbi:hypothetical protein JKL49_02085 [Phenylobacterium sp. 20VBR1]|uniref:Uncharacterized protein n=1 Tax=Phenylobacterium glaciei TaxID=2803784 RepID=A0A941CYE9_9CAUL|nr:hypothetical protein [Phenylobacterium glaciei]MBR7618164.1 hypothetical protein [Phenylobacterium glaciei]